MKNPEIKIFNGDELIFSSVFKLLFLRKKIIIITTILFAIFSVFFSLSLPNIYKSHATLIPVNQSNSLTNVSNQFSGLSAFAGIGLRGMEVSKALEAAERIKSFEFFSNQFLPKVNLHDLMAVSYWDPKTNIITYDDELFDSEKKEWVRKVKFPKKRIPSSQEAYKIFKSIYSVSHDVKNDFLSISIEHHSPHIAKEWLDIIINSMNETVREIDKNISLKSIKYLESQLSQTNLSEVRQALSILLQKEVQTLMLVEANDDYVYKIIEFPFASEKKAKPIRAIICIVLTILGFLISVSFILIQEIYRAKSNLEQSY